jgi:hypothetical protein
MLLAMFATLPMRAALAWWDEGHMQIAYVAYKQLDDAVKENADALLRRNPDYEKWTAGVADPKTAKVYAFIHAATWADDIKREEYHYTHDANASDTAGQNIGYTDHNQHAYWHFKDIDFTPDGSPLPAPAGVDLVTQLKKMIAALPATSGASADLRSYDLVWILHLVGDAHQPLHAASRFTAQFPHGDNGGNAETVVPATGETISLHAYWDRILGGYASPFGAMFDADQRDGLAHVAVDANAAKVADPETWIAESAELARRFAYAAPIGGGKDSVALTRDYETNARNVARKQAALAAARLANLLNAALK